MPIAIALVFLGAWGSIFGDGGNGLAQQSAFFVCILLLGAILFVADRVIQKRSIHIPYIVLPFGLAWFMAVTKLIPLPLWLRSILSPQLTERIETARSVLGEPYNKLMLNVLAAEPPGTAMRVMELLGSVIIVTIIADRLRKRQMQQVTMRVMLYFSAFICIAALSHYLLDIPKMWGTFLTDPNIIRVPLSNGNHRATFYGMLVLLMLAGASMMRHRLERIYFFTAAFVCTSFSFLSLSRAGILILTGVLATLGILAWLVNRDEDSEVGDIFTRLHNWTVPLTGLALLMVGVYVGWELIIVEMGTVENEFAYSHKLHTLRSYWNILPDTWISGTGPYGIKNIFYHHVDVNDPGIHVFSRLNTAFMENAFLQIFSDYGIPGALVLLGAIGWISHKYLKSGVISWSILLLYTSIGFFFLTDLFDYYLDTALGLWSLAFFCGMIGGFVSRHHRLGWDVPVKKIVPASIFLLLLSTPILIYSYQNDRIERNFELMPMDHEEKLVAASVAMARHPLDSFYSRLLAIEYRWRRQYERGLEFANQSLYQKPIMAIVHREAAYINFRLGNIKKSLEHYKTSWALEPNKGSEHLKWAAKVSKNTSDLLSILPEFNAQYLDQYCQYVSGISKGRTLRTCYQHVLKQPDVADAQIAYAAELAIRDGDYEEARLLMLNRLDASPTTPAYQKTLARIDAHMLGLKEIYETSSTWPTSIPESCDFIMWRFDAALSLRKKLDAKQQMARLKACPNYRTFEQYATLEMRYYDHHGELGNSLRVLQKLNQKLNPPAGYLARQANKELQLNLLTQAKSTLSRMKSLHPAHPNTTKIGEQIAQAEAQRQNRQLDAWMRK